MPIDPELGLKLLFGLGITNILFLLMVFFSCRCIAGINFINKMWKYEWYKKYYNYHCYYWWGFMLSVLLHATLAFILFGIPI